MKKSFFFLAALCIIPFIVFGQIDAGNGTENISNLLDPPTITNDTLPDGFVGFTYTVILTANGTMPIQWELEDGNLPPGLSLFSSLIDGNSIFGNPTTEGVFNFTLKAKNSTGYDTKDFSIKIFPEIYIITDTLPNGIIGVDYEQILAAFGTPPITWSLESGSLPQGLTLDTSGIISGNPTTEGVFNLTVKAQNSAGYDTKALSIIVENPIGIIEEETSNIVVFPNPTTGKLTIDNGQLIIDKIEIFDFVGRIVSSNHLISSSSNHKIDISHLNYGIYFVKIVTEQGMVVKKVLKQ